MIDSPQHPYRLYKREKLCSVKAVDTLFAPGQAEGFMAYPLRVVWRKSDEQGANGVRFMITVPKKRLRHAVDRVLMRRRIRESYRLNRQYIDAVSKEFSIDMAFIYVADGLKPYSRIEAAMVKALKGVSRNLLPAVPSTSCADK